MNKVLVITSWNDKGFEIYGKRFLSDFKNKWDSSIDLVVYAEGELPSRTGHQDNIRIAEQPKSLFEWKEKWGKKPEANGNLGPVYNFKFDAVRFANKTFAIFDAWENCQNSYDYLIWLDADVVTHANVTFEWLMGLKPGDSALLSYLGRSSWPECGFMMFDARHTIAKMFFEDWRRMYEEGELYTLNEWHDSYVFGHMLKQYRETFTDRLFRNLGDDSAPDGAHVFINGILGERLDHLKGPRKFIGSSISTDIVNKKMVVNPYWREVKKISREKLLKYRRKVGENFG